MFDAEAYYALTNHIAWFKPTHAALAVSSMLIG